MGQGIDVDIYNSSSFPFPFLDSGGQLFDRIRGSVLLFRTCPGRLIACPCGFAARVAAEPQSGFSATGGSGVSLLRRTNSPCSAFLGKLLLARCPYKSRTACFAYGLCRAFGDPEDGATNAHEPIVIRSPGYLNQQGPCSDMHDC